MGDGHLQPLVAGDRGAPAHCRVAGVVALPGAADDHVAGGTFLHGHRRLPSPVRHVVPHQTAGFGGVDRPGDEERRLVADLAIGFATQFDVLDDRVRRQRRIELTPGTPGNLFVPKAVAAERGPLVDLDPYDAGVAGRRAGR